jgi:hypothetical protein
MIISGVPAQLTCSRSAHRDCLQSLLRGVGVNFWESRRRRVTGESYQQKSNCQFCHGEDASIRRLRFHPNHRRICHNPYTSIKPLLVLATLLLNLNLVAQTGTQQTPPPPAKPADDYSGAYTFLQDGELPQLNPRTKCHRFHPAF